METNIAPYILELLGIIHDYRRRCSELEKQLAVLIGGADHERVEQPSGQEGQGDMLEA